MNTQAASTVPRRSRVTNVIATLTLVGALPTALHVVRASSASPAPSRPAHALAPPEAVDSGFFALPPDTPNLPDPRLDRMRTTLLKNEHATVVRMRHLYRTHPGDRYYWEMYQSVVCGYNFFAPSLTQPALVRAGLPRHIPEPPGFS